jgi:hypothetical protein
MVRESRLLLVAVVTGILVSCGGTDTSSSSSTYDATNDPPPTNTRPTPSGNTTSTPLKLHVGSGTGGADTGVDDTAEQQICATIGATIANCQGQLSCDVDVNEFISQCLASGAFTQADADQLATLPCATIDTGVCEPDDSGDSSGTGAYGDCDAGYTCDTISSEIAFCSLDGAVPTSGVDCGANGIDDCPDGELCLTDASNASYCVQLCDSPACPSGTACQSTGDTQGDFVCLGDGGAVPANAIACDDAGNCPVDYWCFEVDDPDGSAGYLCLKFCFGTD